MSTRKRPLTELRQPSQAQTPMRYAPSTPHAIRALQQRSGAKTRSARSRRVATETVRPDSARGILRRLAKITAPATRRITRTPVARPDKENEAPSEDDDDDGGDERALKKPRMTFDIDESIEEGEDESAPEYEEEEDSDLPAAPTPSVLPEDDNNPTLTFKSIDFARSTLPASERIDRRRSRISVAGDDTHHDDEDDPTMLSEMGRRAISEEPTGRLSRYSFGSIRMSDFGTELEIQRDSGGKEPTGLFDQQGEYGLGFDDDERSLEGETENLGRLRRSMSAPADDTTMQLPVMDESFQLEMPEDDRRTEIAAKELPRETPLQPVEANDEDGWDDVEDEVEAEPLPQRTRQLTELESAAQATTTSKTRRKRLKMTRHGAMVPSLPSSLIKRIATATQSRRGSRKPTLGREHMQALEQATEWFFEQVGEDLSAYANHGRRKKRVDASDVLMLIRRQRVGGDAELRQMARDWLPKDVASSLDLPGRQ